MFTAVCLTFVGGGAYMRQHDARLGCPDWPGCYGHFVIANMLATLPLPGAAAHNGGAAALMAMMVVINSALSRTGSPA